MQCINVIHNQLGRKGSLLYEEGLLTGKLVAVNDNINVRGFCTSAGTKSLKDYKPTSDSPVVEKLKAAGGIVIGIKGSFLSSHFFQKSFNFNPNSTCFVYG